MFKIMSLMSLCLLLAGCLEDKGALVSECLLKYGDKNPSDILDAQDRIMLCMRTKGYQFQERWENNDIGNHMPNTNCYELTEVDGKPYPSSIARYRTPSCYYKVSYFDVIKGKE